jgi:DNA polymerase sigma
MQEHKIDSVRKERDQAIKIIENLVKEQYHYRRSNIVSLKSYGSMTSNLAIDSSDVDLAVVGLDLQG